MKDIITRLRAEKFIQCPDFVESQTHYLAIGGSRAYACHKEDSDYDIVGFCIPSKDFIFPNVILDFDERPRFDQWEAKDITWNQKKYSFNVYNIVKFFKLCAECNPNIIESLYIHPQNVLKMSSIGVIVKEARKEFLHKGAYHRYKSYACSQWHKIKDNKSQTSTRSRHPVDQYDLKFACHTVRLLLQCEQILTEYDLDLMRNAEQLKSVRRGDWSLDQLNEWFHQKVITLEKLFGDSTIPLHSDKIKIRATLLKCLEQAYGSLDKYIVTVDKYEKAIQDIKRIVGVL